jgi:hypothetical protein
MPNPATASVLVRDVAELVTALKACAASCLITLAPGDWRGVQIYNVHAHATINGPGAVLHDLTIEHSSGLTFTGLELSTVGAQPGSWGAGADNWFKIMSSTGIVIDQMQVHGDIHGNVANTPSAFLIRSSQYVTVSNSDFSYLHNAIGFLDDEHLNIDRNTFHNLFDDAMRGGGTSWITISNNFCKSNHPDINDLDHPDCIQFWTTNTNTPAHDIIIRNNTYDRGSAYSTQFIFLGNERNIRYYNISISGNYSYGAGWNAIAVSDAENVNIEKNTLISSCKPDKGVVVTSRVALGQIQGLRLYDNVAGDFIETGPNSGKSQGNNRKAGCMDHSPF